MKNIFNIILVIISFMVLFSACLEKENNCVIPDEGDLQLKNNLKRNILSNTVNIYTQFLYPTDQLAGYTSMQEHPLALHLINTKFADRNTQLKTGDNNFSVKANNIDLNPKQKSTIIDQAILEESWFGKDVSFILKRAGGLKSGENGEDTVNMYIPEQISITSPPVETDEDQFPMCYYENFILRWNADAKNENGLVVSVEWVGAMYAGERQSNVTIQNIDFIEEDDGEYVLDEKLFDGIPDVAIAYITILRGNIDIIEQDDGTTKVYGESHAILPFILIKDLDKYYSMKP